MSALRNKSLLLLLATIAILPIVVFASFSLVNELPNFFNSCMRWGMTSGSSVTVSTAAGACSGITSTSETMLQAALRLMLIQGGILAAFGIGMYGAIRSRPELLTAASAILFLESIPLVFGGLFVLTLLPAGLLTWIARAHPSRHQASTIS